MAVLRLLGTPALETDDGAAVEGRAAQRHRIALLALLGASPGGVSRDKLLALLWPESPSERARNSLNESVYVLRKALGEESVTSWADELRLNPGVVRVDTAEFERHLERGECVEAVRWYRGPFLDGFHLSGAPEFERWMDGERQRLTASYVEALEALAAAAAAAGDARSAVEWRRRLALEDPYDTRAAVALAEALAAAGNRAGALECARAHATLLRAEFELDPSPELVALAERLRGEGAGDPPGGRNEGGSAPRPASPPTPGSGVAAGATVRRIEDAWRSPRDTSATPIARSRRLLVTGAAAGLLLGFLAAPTGRAGEADAADRTPVTLAVLPFHVLSESSVDAFLSVGLADAMITRLAGAEGIRVRPTSAILPYDGRAVEVGDVGRELAVEYVLGGTVQRMEEGIRASVQLVSARDGTPVWAREYRLRRDELPALQDSVVLHLASVFPIPATRLTGRAVTPPPPAAYELYLQGRSRLPRHREPDLLAAVAAFEAAIAQVPGFAPAHAGLAVASAQMHLRFASQEDAPAWGRRAVAAARRALELDPALAEAHEAMAAVHRKTEFDWEGTIRESRRALELNPSSALPHFYIGGALYHLGLLEAAERVVRTGLDVQPSADRVEALRTLGTIALASGRYAEAVSLLQDVQRLSDRPVSDPHLATAYFYLGARARARRMLEDLVGSGSASAASRARATLAAVLANAGEREAALALAREAERGTVDHHVAYSLGAAHAQMGSPAEATRWLRVAADTGFRCYPWFLRDPLLEPIRAHPAFAALMEQLRGGWERDRVRYGS
jgi:DNA-binding SARP family transcriptional activator/TolB-like protein/tetratricopeptide (TPR) repeat protein